MRGYNDFQYTGGEIDIYTEASRSYGVFTNYGLLRMTGGKLTVTAVSSNGFAYALRCEAVSLEGGYARFSAYGPNDAYGLLYRAGTPDVTGGHFKLIGATSAMYREYLGQELTEPAAGMYVYVSGQTDGSGRSMWTSPADGVLTAASGVPSPFHYAEFIDTPLTGDSAHPWLWAGLAGLCLAVFAGMIIRRRRSA
jgi:hypothetical protein